QGAAVAGLALLLFTGGVVSMGISHRRSIEAAHQKELAQAAIDKEKAAQEAAPRARRGRLAADQTEVQAEEQAPPQGPPREEEARAQKEAVEASQREAESLRRQKEAADRQALAATQEAAKTEEKRQEETTRREASTRREVNAAMPRAAITSVNKECTGMAYP